MVDFNTVYKTQDEQLVSTHSYSENDAAVLAFPYQFSSVAKEPEANGDLIDQRMLRPLHSNEHRAILDMIQYRAGRLGQETWITTATFLTVMDVEELDDLRRCDFVRAVEYLVAVETSEQA